MPDVKIVDDRFLTRGAGVIRVEAWIDARTRQVVDYSFAYVNRRLFNGDNGRVVGFDTAHVYPGFASKHHCHWMGVVYEDTRYVSYEQTSERFQRFLRRLKAQHPREY